MFKKLRRFATLLLAFTTILALPASAATIGWNQNSNGNYYYVNSNGTMHTGWLSDGYNNYYFDSNGIWLY